MSFSRRSYAALAHILEFSSRAELDELFYRFGAEDFDRPGANRLQRALALVKAVERERSLDGGSDENTIELLNHVSGATEWHPSEAANLASSLALDGCGFVDGKLIAIIPGPARTTPLISALEARLSEAGLATALKHYQQAIGNFTEARFEAANGQLRSAVEAFLTQAPGLLGLTAAHEPIAGLQTLRSAGRIDVGEFNLLKAFWNNIQDEGTARRTHVSSRK